MDMRVIRNMDIRVTRYMDILKKMLTTNRIHKRKPNLHEQNINSIFKVLASIEYQR